MKELLKEFQDNKVEIVEEERQKKEIKLVGRQRKVPGLILWELNKKTKLVCRAKFNKSDVVIKSLSINPEEITNTHKVIVNEDCDYIQALNFENALKQFGKMGYTNLVRVENRN